MSVPLVSLLCPCYNAHNYINRFMNSILKQTYKNIQVIMINDGSSDDTLEILQSYQKHMTEFTEYLILNQENGGAASAINMALKYVKGEYLAWADCDDVLYTDNIRLKVEFLEEHPECGLVNCQAESFVEDQDVVTSTLAIKKEEQEDNIFERLIFPGVPCYPGVFMIRTNLLFKRIPDRNIVYHREVGQNWQLLLPVAYDNKCGYINEPLYGYCVRMDSHSHGADLRRQIERTYYGSKIISEILSFMDKESYEEIMKRVNQQYASRRIDAAYRLNDRELFMKEYHLLSTEGYVFGKKMRIKKLLIQFPFLKKCVSIIKK